MRIALFGATGRVSGRLLEYALAEGDTVHAPARNPEKVQPLSLAGLTVITGDVLDLAPRSRTRHHLISGAEAVISILEGGTVQRNRIPVKLCHRYISWAKIEPTFLQQNSL